MPPTTNNPKPRRNRLRDYAAYVAISLVLISIPFAVAISGYPIEPFLRYFFFALYLVLRFGQFLSETKHLWRDKIFWAAIALLLLAHLPFFRYMPTGAISVFQLAPVFLVETALFTALRRWRESALHYPIPPRTFDL